MKLSKLKVGQIWENSVLGHHNKIEITKIDNDLVYYSGNNVVPSEKKDYAQRTLSTRWKLNILQTFKNLMKNEIS